jgi:hypothetical protein
LNGRDDDADGDTDCGDSDCGSFACFDVPMAWTGLGILFEGPEAQVPDCPGDFATPIDLGGSGPQGAPAICSACSCSVPDTACTATLSAYRNSRCDMRPNVATPERGSGCTILSGGFAPRSYLASAPSLDAAACAPVGGEATVPPLSWTTRARVCAMTSAGDGCAHGGRCAPSRADVPFLGGICVWRDGEHACPAGYDDRHVFAQTPVDTRGCTPCSCGQLSATCTMTTTLFSDFSCTDAVGIVVNNDVCLPDAPMASAFSASTTILGGCPASGGAPTGDVNEGASKTTVCCAR